INTAVAGGTGYAASVGALRHFLRGSRFPELGVRARRVHPAGRQGAGPAWLLLEVEPDGAAARASLRAGDVLLESPRGAPEQVRRLSFLRGSGPPRRAAVRLGAVA
ncbi:MAG: hypothetical protein ACRD2D_09745, partial [Terriglobales bacterium]